MSSTAARAVAESTQEAALPGSKEGAWKWALRQRMWDYMEEHDIARWVGRGSCRHYTSIRAAASQLVAAVVMHAATPFTCTGEGYHRHRHRHSHR
jgi:hypothetical protein